MHGGMMAKKYEPLSEPFRVTYPVYCKLVEMKYTNRKRSIDEVIRMLLGMPENHPKVKRYSDERIPIHLIKSGNDGYTEPELTG